MLAKLFQRLTADPSAATTLFDWVTKTARRPDWYLRGAVPDTIDGRFAMLATIGALVVVRLEQLGEEGARLAVALTERFARVMESEHRELGIGDPTLGKTVLRLVGALARRVELWRRAEEGELPWADAVRDSLPQTDDSDATSFRESQLRLVSQALASADLEQLALGALR